MIRVIILELDGKERDIEQFIEYLGFRLRIDHGITCKVRKGVD